MTTTATHEDHLPLIHMIAKTWRSRFPQAEHSDLVQEMLCWWYGSGAETVEKALALEDEKERIRLLSRRLHDIAHNYARRERALALGYKPEDEAFYPPALLEELLPLALVGATAPMEKSEVKPNTDPAEGHTFLVMMVDINEGFAHLGGDDMSLLRYRFGDGMSNSDLALQLGLAESTLSSRVQRALRRLSNDLGGSRPRTDDGPGTRRVMTNAAAQAVTQRNEGD